MRRKLILFARRLLIPLIPLYRSALALRELRLRSGLEPVRRLRFPVVSIGNLSTGGSGKTPLTIALAKALAYQECNQPHKAAQWAARLVYLLQVGGILDHSDPDVIKGLEL